MADGRSEELFYFAPGMKLIRLSSISLSHLNTDHAKRQRQIDDKLRRDRQLELVFQNQFWTESLSARVFRGKAAFHSCASSRRTLGASLSISVTKMLDWFLTPAIVS